jgi:uncharacterized protein YneR
MLDNHSEKLIGSLVEAGISRVLQNPMYPFGYSDHLDTGRDFSMRVLSNEAFNRRFDQLGQKHTMETLAGFFLNFEPEQIPPYWKRRFEEFATLEYIKSNYNDFFSANSKRIELGTSLRGKCDSFTIAAELFDSVTQRKHVPGGYISLLKKAAKESPLSAKLFIEARFLNNKKSNYYADVRAALYSCYVSSGFLTEKVARKIRSDSSYYASLEGLTALIQNKDLYKDNYEELLLKFSDSRHEVVLRHLASNMPLYLLSSLLGCDNDHVKSMVERRMTNGK